MILLMSPAKMMRSHDAQSRHDRAFIKETRYLSGLLKKWSVNDLQTHMKLSKEKAHQTHEMLKNWGKKTNQVNGAPALYAYIGEAYKSLDADSLNLDELIYLKESLYILSGLYGVLRADDFIEPYRLEMAQRGLLPTGISLYAYWEKAVNTYFHLIYENQALINLASSEYSAVIQDGVLRSKMITPTFFELKNGQLKAISVFSKQARGAMIRWCASNQVKDPEKIKHFDLLGYRFSKELSNATEWVFVR